MASQLYNKLEEAMARMWEFVEKGEDAYDYDLLVVWRKEKEVKVAGCVWVTPPDSGASSSSKRLYYMNFVKCLLGFCKMYDARVQIVTSSSKGGGAGSNQNFCAGLNQESPNGYTLRGCLGPGTLGKCLGGDRKVEGIDLLEYSTKFRNFLTNELRLSPKMIASLRVTIDANDNKGIINIEYNRKSEDPKEFNWETLNNRFKEKCWAIETELAQLQQETGGIRVKDAADVNDAMKQNKMEWAKTAVRQCFYHCKALYKAKDTIRLTRIARFYDVIGLVCKSFRRTEEDDESILYPLITLVDPDIDICCTREAHQVIKLFRAYCETYCKDNSTVEPEYKFEQILGAHEFGAQAISKVFRDVLDARVKKRNMTFPMEVDDVSSSDSE